MYINADYLRQRKACNEQVEIFNAEWPSGVEITRSNLERAQTLGLNLEWFIFKLVIAQAWTDYERVRAQAQTEYERVRDLAWAEHEHVPEQAWVEFARKRDQAGAEYNHARDAAQIEIILRYTA